MNLLTSLPDNFGNLVKLQSLDLGINKLTSLPDNFGNLVKLQSLKLGMNEFTSLPDSFGNLVNLQSLVLGLNKFSSLPESLKNLVNLQRFDLKNNPLVSLSNIPMNALKIADVSIDNLSGKGQSLFSSNDYDELLKYYIKSPLTLAQEYSTNPKSLSSDEKERLIYESSHLEKKILEIKVNPSDPILAMITERLVVKLPTGYKLHL